MPPSPRGKGPEGMLHRLLRAKIHRATVTATDLDYVGSLTMDQDLMDAAGILPNEAVLVADLDNGARHTTYAMPGRRGSGTVCVNGAAARLVKVGDRVIIMCFGYFRPEEATVLKPKIVLLDEGNRVAGRL
jgi:aspartate 1-decarboxylase